MVGIPTQQGNLGNRQLAVQQQPRSFLQPRLVNHLPWRELKHPLAVPLQLRHGIPGNGSQFGKADGPGKVTANMRIHRRQFLKCRMIRLR
ncbi:hypothetical protein D3C71_1034840 [compost metagenome]